MPRRRCFELSMQVAKHARAPEEMAACAADTLTGSSNTSNVMTRRQVAVAFLIVFFAARPALSSTLQGPTFPHDSQLLQKLHDRRFSEIGTTTEVGSDRE